MINKVLEKDLIPEVLIRHHIRKLLSQRITEETRKKEESSIPYRIAIRQQLSKGPIAIETEKANEQHYELPARFFELVLGSNLKYSSGLWEDAKELSKAESDMLRLTSDRAKLSEGQKILELGCGWGSLTLHIARNYPGSYITAVSNSVSQAEFIRKRAELEGLTNIKVITRDINDLDLDEKFDRIVSVEMFEHMRNYELLLKKVTSWLEPGGLLFVHIFTHKDLCYKFDNADESDWMARYFFSGGIMPSDWLLHEFSDIIKVKEHWKVKGTNYSATAEAWLSNMKLNKKEIMEIFRNVYPGNELKWFVYWKIFFMSCSELWNYNQGEEWIVSHYLLEK